MDTSWRKVALPAVRFLASDEWRNVEWSGTTFRCHPTSEAPPVMGLVFDNALAGEAIFRNWTKCADNRDVHEELRITIVEGEFTNSRPGYIVHLCPDPQNTLAHATAEGIVFDVEQFGSLCRANRMDFLPDIPPMLERFKQEYAKHREFLLAPVTERDDGQMYFDVQSGIVKKKIEFMAAEDILAELKAQGVDIELIRKLILEGEGSDTELPTP